MKNQAIEIFRKNKSSILDSWNKQQLADTEISEDSRSNGDLQLQSREILDAFVSDLSERNIDYPTSTEFSSVLDTLKAISLSRARQGYSPRETGIFVMSLKQALNEALQLQITDPYELNIQTLKVGKIIDSFGVATFETFIKGREEEIFRQSDEINEIATPVIQVWQGILALPIIGTLDSARAQVVMENLLKRMVDTDSSIAILDISGVPAIDSLVAQHLIQTVTATRLIGAECIISGIRPEIAQTVVHLGIDLSNVITKTSLATALKLAFKMRGIQVQKSAG